MANKWCEVRSSDIHGTGVFAIADIPKGEKIIEYVGDIISKEESDKRADDLMEQYQKDKKNLPGVFIFQLNDKQDIDGNVDWNPARFINFSCNPNAESENIDDHIWILAKRDIKKGDEIFYDYGYDWESYEDHPCYCGSHNCIGYIVGKEHWTKVKKHMARKKLKDKRKAQRQKALEIKKSN